MAIITGPKRTPTAASPMQAFGAIRKARGTAPASAAADELAPTGVIAQTRAAEAAANAPAPTDPFAGDNTAAFAADQDLKARRAAAGASGVLDSDNNADLLGGTSAAFRRRGAAARALLG